MLNKVKNSLPLKITDCIWDGTILQLIGTSWNFTTLSSWRVSNKQKIVFGCFDSDSSQYVNDLKNNDIVDIFCQTDFHKIDPIFCLSNGQYIEIFTTDTYEPWTLNIGGVGFFVPTPSDPMLFENSIKDF